MSYTEMDTRNITTNKYEMQTYADLLTLGAKIHVSKKSSKDPYTLNQDVYRFVSSKESILRDHGAIIRECEQFFTLNKNHFDQDTIIKETREKIKNGESVDEWPHLAAVFLIGKEDITRELFSLSRDIRISPELLQIWKNTPINIDKTLFKDYRKYQDYPVKESNEPMVATNSKDAYWDYSQTPPEKLIEKQKLKDLIAYTSTEESLDETEANSLAFDSFNTLPENKKSELVLTIAKKFGFKATKATLTPEESERIRQLICLHYGNLALRPVVPENGNIKLRKTVAEAIERINTNLKPLGYQVRVETGHRSEAQQLVMKQNHARLRGQQEANNLYADIGKSDHHSGGAVDLILIGADGKEVNLRLGDNKEASKGLLYGEELLGTKGDQLTPEEKQAIEGRRILFHVMTSQGFSPLITEYWHYGMGSRLPSHLHWKETGEQIPAKYGNK